MYARANGTLPSLPDLMNSWALWWWALLRRCVPAWTTRLYLRAASTILRPSTMLCEIGFST